MRDLEHLRRRYADHVPGLLGARHSYAVLCPLVERPDGLHLEAQGDRVLSMLLGDIHIVQPGGGIGHQAHRPPDARIRQPGPPVPAEHAVCLTKMRKSLHCLMRTTGIHLCILFFNILCRGVKNNL